jgi:hypothetical protein
VHDHNHAGEHGGHDHVHPGHEAETHKHQHG